MTFHSSPSANRSADADLPPGQHMTKAFPMLSTGSPPVVRTEDWEFTLATETGQVRRWDWAALRSLPSKRIVLDLHCVSGWSVLGSTWDATSVHRLFDGVQTSAQHVVVHSYADYTTNLPLDDLLEMPTWIAFALDGHDLPLEHGGPARLLVPHLYLWKSVKWVRGITLTIDDQPGSRERAGYHNYGDPWREQRFQGD